MDTILRDDGSLTKVNEFFAKKLKYNYSDGKKIAGLFFINDSEIDQDIKKHQRYITSLLSNYAKAYLDYIKDQNQENLRKRLNELYQKLKEFIQQGETKIQNAALSKKDIIERESDFQFMSEEGKKSVYRATLGDKPEIGNLNIFYFSDDNFLRETEDRLLEIEDPLERLRIKSISIKTRIMEDILLKIQNIDPEVKTWIEMLIASGKSMEKINSIMPVLQRVFGIIDIDYNLYIPEQEEEAEEEFYRPVIGKIAVGDKKLSFNEVIQKSAEKSSSLKDPQELLSYLNFLKDRTEIDFQWLIKKLYPENPENNNQFLDKLGEVIEEYLKLSLKGNTIIKPVTYKKDHNPVLEIQKGTLRTRKSRVVILHENLNSNEVDNLIKVILEMSKKEKSNLPGIKNILVTKKDKANVSVSSLQTPQEAKKHIRIFNMDQIFTDYSYLKSVDSSNYKQEDGLKLINFLMQFAGFMIAILNYEKRLKENIICFAMVDKRFFPKNSRKPELKETYDFWDMVRVISSMVGFPLQTINTSDQIEDKVYKKLHGDAMFKNLIYSAFKDNKEIDYVFTENRLVNIGPKAEVFLIVEHSSPYLHRNEKTFFYEVMKMDIDFSAEKVITVSRYTDPSSGKKAFFMMPGNDIMVKKFKDFLDYKPENKECFKFILTTQSRSPIYSIVEQHQGRQNVFILTYRGLKTPIILKELKKYNSSKTMIDTGFLIYSHELKKGLKNLRLPEKFYQKQKSFFGITPFLPKGIFKDEKRFNSIINTEVSLIFPEDGVDDLELFNLMVNTIILWLNYRTETYGYSYSKPKFLPKKLPSVTISRNIGREFTENYPYVFDGFSLCAEISYLIQKFYTDYI